MDLRSQLECIADAGPGWVSAMNQLGVVDLDLEQGEEGVSPFAARLFEPAAAKHAEAWDRRPEPPLPPCGGGSNRSGMKTRRFAGTRNASWRRGRADV